MHSNPYPFDRKVITITVISDLVTDYRVHKTCQTLHNQGFQVFLTGHCKKGSSVLKQRDYHTDRIKTWFQNSFLFYAEFNIRLLFRLLRRKTDFLLGNDLDVMPATAFLAILKKKPLIYDSHEYFLGMAGLEEKPLRQKIWKRIESLVFSRLKYIYTVSDPIRNIYENAYKKEVRVVRNLPILNPDPEFLSPEESEKIQSYLSLIPTDKYILLFQGAGINASRGAEELILSMKYLDCDRFHLIIIGGGDVFETLRDIVDQHQLSDRITFIPKLPFSILPIFTRRASLGFSIDKPAVPNHFHSLPNKLFEYLHAGVPVLASRLPEQEKIVKEYEVGGFIDHHEPVHIAQKIESVFADTDLLKRWKENTFRVRNELNWEKESQIILDIFKQVEMDSVNH